MARPPQPSRRRLLEALRRVTTETDRYVDVVGAAHASSRTDMLAVSCVVEAAGRGEESGPGSIGRALGLSSPATTALLDRLEGAGHVRRVRSGTDRRRVVVEVTDSARALGRAVFSPMARDLGVVLDTYTDAEVAVVQRFLDDAAEAISRGRAVHAGRDDSGR